MKPRLLIAFTLIVLAPLAVLGWLGAKLARDEQAVVEHRFSQLMLSQLRSVDSEIAGILEQWKRHLQADLPSLPQTPADLREHARESTLVDQYFLLDSNGMLVYPSLADELTPDEDAFLARTREIWERQSLTNDHVDEGAGGAGQQGGKLSRQKIVGPPQPQEGWYTWYWGDGTHLMYWMRDGAGRTRGAELRVARLKSDIVVALPDTPLNADSGGQTRTALLDAKGTPMYLWGAYTPPVGEAPRATMALSYPLGGWSLAYYASPELYDAGLSRGVWFNVASGLAVLAAAVIGLAVYFYRESSRDIREAAQRVSFVNQVSHELKTPLTNIRMYAELLDQELGEDEEKPRRHLDIIVSESQRLSRLIGNVLTFSRKDRRALKLRPEPGVVDDIITAILDHYEPALTAKEIVVEFDGKASQSVMVDADVLEQIVGNLVSNVEKYAAAGKRLLVSSAQEGDYVTVTVADDGPGVPPADRERIFQPFYRVSNQLSDGVAGTGIGLAIARDLARLHGGDLQLIPSETGATFRLTLQCSLVPEGGMS